MAYPADESLILTLYLPHQTEPNRTDDDSFALNIVLLAVDYYILYVPEHFEKTRGRTTRMNNYSLGCFVGGWMERDSEIDRHYTI